MRLPRVRFTIRRMMFMTAGVAALFSGGMWFDEMRATRAGLITRAAVIGANEKIARKYASTPKISAVSLEYWSSYAEHCRRVRQHCERAASRPWVKPGPDPSPSLKEWYR